MIVTHEKCYVCGAITNFNIIDGATLLREAVCDKCNASIRNSDIAKIIVEVILGKKVALTECIAEFKDLKILEASASGSIHNILKSLPAYTCFEYFDNIQPGNYKEGILCNDLQKLTFDDNMFDLVITQDVLEHVKNPNKAFSEINRVLKESGYHIFSVPFHEGRLSLDRSNLPEVKHGDPLRQNGVIVYTDWGKDICSIIDKSGMHTYYIKSHNFYDTKDITNVDKSYSEYLNKAPINYFRYNSVTFVSRKKSKKESEMEFTGERFVPNASLDKELEIEHLQRYYSIINLVKGKVIVDAATGEGYGANILAEHASIVYGIDISEEAILHAKEKYKKSNLSYLKASIDSLPLEDDSVDVVVSFETIEHVDEGIQKSFLNEVKRILKKDGILVISTPNKYVYSDLRNYKNEYHVKEFYEEEFYNFLANHFANIKFYNQGLQVASVVANDDIDNLQNIKLSKKQKNMGMYIIAVCSNSMLERKTDIKSVVLDSDNKYNKLMERIIELQEEVEKKNSHINILNEAISSNDKVITSLNIRVEELSVWGTTLDKKIRNKDEEIRQKDEKIRNKDEEIRQKDEEIRNKDEEIRNKDEEIRNKDGHIEQLLQQERVLNTILNSRCWKLVQNYYKFRKLILPDNSKRKLLAKMVYKTVKNPKNTVKHVNIENMKKFIRYLIKENTGMLEDRIDSYFDKHKTIEKPVLEIYCQKEEKLSLIFDQVKSPLVSIIIPVYNQWNFTYSCLESILVNTKGTDYEVIIADDVSSDETVNISKYVENIKVVRNEKNLGFLLNCNNAAKHARGKYLLFLNNDTNVQKDWLKYLIDLIEKDEQIGMVGSKLVYQDGRQQEAGGIIWKDASGWNYGRLDDPEKPEYNYVKEVDYISGASIMIRSSLWKEIGGFDERYVPAYFEDSDLAFEVRKHGYKVVFQPKSIVVHFEGISHGTDTNSGIKSYQIKNREKFIEKWKEVLGKEHFENGQNVFWARDRSRNRKTILVIDHYVPHYDKDAGSRTTFQYLKLFVEMGLNVKFLGDNFYKHEPYTTELEQLGIEVLYGVWYRDNYERWIQQNSDKFEYVYLNRPHISEKYIDYLKKNIHAKIIYYGHDLHYLRESREYEIFKNKEILVSAEKWKKVEHDLIRKADAVYYPSQIEIDEIIKYFPNIIARAIPAYIFNETLDIEIDCFEERNDLLFVGGFSHKPNVDAVLWFINDVFPLILKELPEIKFYIVGSNPPDIIRNLQSPNVKVTGFISDEELTSYYQRCRLVIVPLRYGAGVKGKVVEALYHQLPIVTTTIGAEGLNDCEKILTIADNNKDFADKVIKLYQDTAALKNISQNTSEYIRNFFSKKSALDIISNDIKP